MTHYLILHGDGVVKPGPGFLNHELQGNTRLFEDTVSWVIYEAAVRYGCSTLKYKLHEDLDFLLVFC